ncbi:hypothetical protein [Plebeiibacterium marinum]|uniref:Uncharacterized protein n=1 Tax=Plebeiibacterium marinum TaxID=2992111 RepID=A0AAE3MGT1_9BACT|nr:hypothetical protein [Plebeiobacterium marinum]MCW3807210.1 hypothetical protein [Plebeiobacterium marinum]
MKTQVNHHNHHLTAVGVLISLSVVLLAFGIYKTVVFQQNEMFNSYTYTSESVAASYDVNNLNAANEFEFTASEAPIEMEEWMTDYSSWLVEPEQSATTFGLSDYVEETLPIENWMTNTSEWLNTVATDQVFEEELVVEDWMLSTSEWVTPITAIDFTHDEKELEIESWMVSIDQWNVPLLTTQQWNEINNNQEETLAVENWMIQCCTWLLPHQMNSEELYDFSQNIMEEALVLEPWMTNVESWLIEETETERV